MKKHEKTEKQEQFLKLRGVQGKSYDAIAQELDISKQTALNWAAKLTKELRNIENFELERVLDECKLLKRQRLESLAANYKRVQAELDSRKLDDVNSETLLKMLLKLKETIDKETEAHTFYSDEYASVFEELEHGLEYKKLPLLS